MDRYIKQLSVITFCLSLPLSCTTGTKRDREPVAMHNLEATFNDRELKLKKGQALVVGFPKQGRDETMGLFYDFPLNDSASTWIPNYEMPRAKAMKEVPPDTLPNGEAFDSVVRVDYHIEITADLYDYGFSVTARTGTFHNLLLKGRDITIVDFIADFDNVDSAVAIEFWKNNWRVEFDLNINEDGIMNNFRLADNEYVRANGRAQKLAIDFLKSVPPFDLASHEEEVLHDWDYTIGFTATRSLNKARFKAKFRKKYADYVDKAIQKMDKNTLDYYMFAVTGLGWINSDRFLDLDDEQKTDFIVTAPLQEAVKVHLVFSDIGSIITGELKDGRFLFRNVPLNRKVKVIGISYRDGQPLMSVAETVIDEDGFELATFKAFTLDELEEALNGKSSR